MTINRDNYEIYMIDYLDNNLSPEMVDELMLFLDKHPDIKEESSNLNMDIQLADNDVVFEDKAALKQITETTQNITKDNCETWFIASVEGTLNQEEKQLLNEYLNTHPELQKEYQLLTKTKLSPDLSIRFDGKRKLKKFVIGFSSQTVYSYAAVAAAVALLIGFSWNFMFPPETIYNGLANLDRSEIQARDNYTPKTGQQAAATEDRTENALPSTTSIANRSQIVREQAAEIKPLQSNHKVALLAQQEARLDPDYRIYIRNLYHVNYSHAQKRNNVMMAMTNQSKTKSLEGLAWERIERSTGVEKTNAFKDEKKNIFWTAVDLGLSGINKLTGSNLAVKRKVNEYGELSSYRLKSDAFEVSRNQ